MKIIYSKEDFNDIFAIVEHAEDYILDNVTGFEERHNHIKSKVITAHVTRLFLDGVHVAFFNESRKEGYGNFVRTDGPYLQMHFELGGSTYYTAKDYGGMDCSIPEGYHTLFYFPALYGHLVYPATNKKFGIEIEISLNYLKQAFNGDLSVLGAFANDIDHERPAMLGGKSFPITAKIKEILLGMYYCPFVDQLKKIYIEGKLLELLSVQIAQLMQKDTPSPTGKLRSEELEKIMEARKIIEGNLETPFSIEEMAKIIGINRTKLQKNFKEVHGNTIYGLIADLRMEKAQELLRTEKSMKIAEIAQKIGYKNPNHFSAAYKRKFGSIPRWLKEP